MTTDRSTVEYGTLITGDESVAMGDAAVQTTDESVRTTAETVVTPVVALDLAAEILTGALGPLIDADYVQGKTQFRDVLCDRIDISQLEAEELVDDMERSGRIRFIGAEEGRGWHVQQGVGAR
ncbi:hypothetical protein BE04_18655 [Sorangium cellulosum]|uniref:Uncharacterized protein n=2 Tax=Sorangium cellulosum TaxID=56 RepID=A0A150P9L7_SORCE|nr:hypothetical protein [Sorangium cellulosum]AGP40402.1 hypothetical protein SCE1572_41410 [Sorangium cellulosum So0157-2]KYF52168.1 hypothetical protein BE04_18655 [Sorangium cellulosum]KYG10255.1 hypothetical protein BE21_13135 [Sorangium cellulosum]